MPLTRAQRKDALQYIIKTVFEYEADDSISKALKYNGIEDISALICLTNEDVNNLDFRNESGNMEKLDKGRIGLIRCFRAFHSFKQSTVTHIGDEWNKIEPGEFEDYRISPECIAAVNCKPPPNQYTIQSPTSTSKAKISDAISQFTRSIKRDPTLFPILKNQRNWDKFNRILIATAQAQDMSDVLNPDYLPTTSEETDLFDRKQSFVYCVFVKTLLTDNGKKFIRQHEKDYDAMSLHPLLAKLSTLLLSWLSRYRYYLCCLLKGKQD